MLSQANSGRSLEAGTIYRWGSNEHITSSSEVSLLSVRFSQRISKYIYSTVVIYAVARSMSVDIFIWVPNQ